MKTFLIILHILGIISCVAGAILNWESNNKAATWAITASIWCFSSLMNVLAGEDNNGN